MTGKFGENPYYVEYETLLKELNRVMAAGKSETDEADAIRDAMEWPERELSRPELDRLRGLSADLYMLQDDEIYERTDPAERTLETLGVSLKSAWDRGDMEETLALLRKGPEFLPKHRIAYTRATAYAALGHLDTALLFMDYAAKLAPGNPVYRLQAKVLLGRMHRLDEVLDRATRDIEDEQSTPETRIRAVIDLVKQTQGGPIEQTRPACERAIGVLEPALQQAQLGPDVRPWLLGAGYWVLGECRRQLGQLAEAMDAFDAALVADPSNEEALVARGELHYETENKAAAMEDFERAAGQNARLITPYLYLAHRALDQDAYEKCLKWCNKALAPFRLARPEQQAVALQWSAIARHHLGHSRSVIQREFEVAITLDPLNARIQANFDLFRRLTRVGPSGQAQEAQWEIPEVPERRKDWADGSAVGDLLPAA